MVKSLVEMAADIMAAQASQSRMTPEEITEGLQKTYAALRKIQAQEGGELEVVQEKVRKPEPSASIQRNRIICLECGREFKQLSKSHLASHALTPKSYKQKYSLPLGTALTAKSLSARRRKLAKERGLGEKLAQARKGRSRK
jgi:predicted transcriptional regulator